MSQISSNCIIVCNYLDSRLDSFAGAIFLVKKNRHDAIIYILYYNTDL